MVFAVERWWTSRDYRSCERVWKPVGDSPGGWWAGGHVGRVGPLIISKKKLVQAKVAQGERKQRVTCFVSLTTEGE